jgi:hypothetical protein
MKTLLKVVLVCGLLSLAPIAATAQSNTPTCSGTGNSHGSLQVRSFAGCPFSAVVEITHTQTLGDGSHIVTKVKALSYRDSAGRIGYQSFTVKDTDTDKDASEGPNMIQIYDTVAGFIYMILPDHSAAWRSKLSGLAPVVGDLPRHVYATEAAVSSFGPDARVKFVSEDLGSRQMQGVPVIGTRTVRTIPAGVEGNDHELTVTSETWYSRELGFALLQKTSDPRSKDREVRVTSLQQSEPNPNLFLVPTGYTIVVDQ